MKRLLPFILITIAGINAYADTVIGKIHSGKKGKKGSDSNFSRKEPKGPGPLAKKRRQTRLKTRSQSI